MNQKLTDMEHTEKKIITDHIRPPIPDNRFDWMAVREHFDEGDLVGYGATEQEAINDLKQQENEK